MIKIILVVAVVLLVLLILSFIPLWPKPGKGGNTYHVNTWTKIQLMRGEIYID
jgi:hypothetical protein